MKKFLRQLFARFIKHKYDVDFDATVRINKQLSIQHDDDLWIVFRCKCGAKRSYNRKEKGHFSLIIGERGCTTSPSK